MFKIKKILKIFNFGSDIILTEAQYEIQLPDYRRRKSTCR